MPLVQEVGVQFSRIEVRGAGRQARPAQRKDGDEAATDGVEMLLRCRSVGCEGRGIQLLSSAESEGGAVKERRLTSPASESPDELGSERSASASMSRLWIQRAQSSPSNELSACAIVREHPKVGVCRLALVEVELLAWGGVLDELVMFCELLIELASLETSCLVA